MNRTEKISEVIMAGKMKALTVHDFKTSVCLDFGVLFVGFVWLCGVFGLFFGG